MAIAAEWKQASGQQRKVILVNVVSLGLSIASASVSEVILKRPGLSATDKTYLKEISERGFNAITSIQQAGYAGEADVASLALSPAITLLGFFGTVTSAEVVGAAVLLKSLTVDNALAFMTYFDIDADYSSQDTILVDAIRKVLEQSVSVQIQRVNDTKNVIDTTCS